MSENALDSKLESRLYEVAYLVTPLITEEEILATVDAALRLPVDQAGGLVTGVTHPKRQPLAYAVGKSVNHKRTLYREAYFGAIRFELDPVAVEQVKKSLTENELVLRFITAILPRRKEVPVAPRRPVAARRSKSGDKIATPAKPELSKEEIDKEIEGLLAEAA